MSLIATHLGTFGRPSHPSILWMGIDGDIDPLQRLQRQLAGALDPLGIAPEERRFHPHVTLARAYIGQSPFQQEDLEKFQAAWTMEASSRFTATGIVLYQSHLGVHPMYEPIASFPFGKTTDPSANLLG